MKFVITGGPCSGKTTILNRLKEIGYQTLNESAREIIKYETQKSKQDKNHSPILPWTNYEKFQERVIEKQCEIENNIDQKMLPAFLDRSLVDAVAYCSYKGINSPKGVNEKIKNAEYTRIIFLENLPFYINDTQRKESAQESKKIANHIYTTYKKYNFQVIKVPYFECRNFKESIEKRIDFMWGALK